MKKIALSLSALLALSVPSGAQAFDTQQAMRLFMEVSRAGEARLAEPRQLDPRKGAVREVYDGDSLTIIDGDTFALPCENPFPNCAEKIRLVEPDAPESVEPRCDAELPHGLRAKEELAKLLRGRKVRIIRSGKDRFKRTLASAIVPEGNVGEIMIERRLALRYEKGPEAWEFRRAHWCPEFRGVGRSSHRYQ